MYGVLGVLISSLVTIVLYFGISDKISPPGSLMTLNQTTRWRLVDLDISPHRACMCNKEDDIDVWSGARSNREARC